ncbi:hypothetical protein IMY05_C5318000600 [Salix suchowensis]|nr:hypothetical protein IMY05_C5318000600 [Salix suchowensis]
MVDHPKYYKDHWIVSHPFKKYFVRKGLIVHMDNEGKIQLEGREETASTNMTMVAFRSFDLVLLPSSLYKKKLSLMIIICLIIYLNF